MAKVWNEIERHEIDIKAFRVFQELLMRQAKDDNLFEAILALSWLEARLNVSYEEV